MDDPLPRDQMRADAERLADIFTALQRSFVMKLSTDLARGSVSFPNYFVMGLLCQQKQLSMAEIAQKMGHTTAEATGLGDRLEKLRPTHRAHTQNDRRKILVQPTPKGSRLVSEVREDVIAKLLRLMGRLHAEEQKSWVGICEKLHAY